MYRTILLSSLLTLSPYSSWAGHDPMRPEIIEAPPQQSAQTLDTSHWRLMLIRQAGEERVALLNGRLLKVGGRIDGAQVKAIEAHKVILQLADERSIEIRLPSVELRKIGE